MDVLMDSGRSLAIAAVVAVGLFVIARRWKKRRQGSKEEREKVANQVKRDPDLSRIQPRGKGAPIFSGLRVVDLATHIAAPTASRCLADLGAEVIKVETPGGDIFRDTLLRFQPGRKFGTLFEGQNAGKHGVQLDLKKEDDLKELDKLLKDADVIITNIRKQSLKRLKLDYESLHERFPHLIYAQISAWGLKGKDCDLPGYDIGAFWAASGFSAMMNWKTHSFSLYPGGMGDLTTGQAVLTGVCFALYERMETGLGQYFTTSLLHTGSWCIGPWQVEPSMEQIKDDVVPNYEDQPPQGIVDQFYWTSDDFHVAICYNGDFGAHDKAEKELCKLVGLEDRRKINEAIRSMTRTDLESRLNSCEGKFEMIEYVDVPTRWELEMKTMQEKGRDTRLLNVDPHIKGIDDLPFMPRIPMEFSCSKLHGPKKGAPDKGEATDDILMNGWTPRPSLCELPRASPGAFHSKRGEKRSPLRGVVVLEVGDVKGNHDICVRAAASILQQAGARVIRFEPPEGDSLKGIHPKLYRDMNHGKEIQSTTEIENYLSIANLIITDMPKPKLRRMDLEYDSLARRFPSLVLVHVVPSVEDDFRDDSTLSAMSSIYAVTGLAQVYAGIPPKEISRFPEHSLELIASIFTASTASIALFHQRATNEGQCATMSYERLGIWLGQVNSVFSLQNPKFGHVAYTDTNNTKRNSPLSTYSSYRTKDGMYMQLLGLNIERHLNRTLKALGIQKSVYARLLWTGLTKVLPNRSAPSVFSRLEPLFIIINDAIYHAFLRFTFEELKQRFKEHDVWWAPVRMPVQLLDYDQQDANEVYDKSEAKDVRVTSPLQFHT